MYMTVHVVKYLCFVRRRRKIYEICTQYVEFALKNWLILGYDFQNFQLVSLANFFLPPAPPPEAAFFQGWIWGVFGFLHMQKYWPRAPIYGTR